MPNKQIGVIGTSMSNYSDIKGLFKHKPRHYHIKLPDREFDVNADFIAFQNVQTAGGGLLTNGTGVLDDGHLDLVIMHHRNFGRMNLNAIALFRGKLHFQPNMEIIPYTEAEVTLDEKPTLGSLDGELLDFNEVKLTMGPRIRFLH